MTQQPSFDQAFCEARYGRQYLWGLVESAKVLSKPESPSSLTVFSSRIDQKEHLGTEGRDRVDTCFFGRSAYFDHQTRKFVLPCGDVDHAELDGLLPEYMFATGPRHVFRQAVDMVDPKRHHLEDEPAVARVTTTVVLLAREGETNIWHCLMEIMSLFLTVDVLRTAHDPATGEPYLREADAPDTRAIILDGRGDGRFFSLWRAVARRPIVRIGDIAPGDREFDRVNIIVPLAGGSNPFWTGTFEAHPCDNPSPLLATFAERVLAWYGVSTDDHDDGSEGNKKREGDVVVTFNDRRWRRLTEQDTLLDALRSAGLRADVRAVDLGALPFAEQLRTVRTTDVLVGAHGAGMTHAAFLRPGSAVVEILPPGFHHRGFRNLAIARGHTYFCAYADACLPLTAAEKRELAALPEFPVPDLGSRRRPHQGGDDDGGDNDGHDHDHEEEDEGKEEEDQERDWHFENMVIGRDRFLELAKTAVLSMYNKGMRDFAAV